MIAGPLVLERSVEEMLDKTALKEKVVSVVERNTLERLVNTRETSDEDFVNSLFSDDFYNEEFCEELKTKVQEQEKVDMVEDDGEETAVREVANVHVIEADEIRPELVEYIASEVVTKLQFSQAENIKKFIHGRVISQEEFFKLQLWSYFPIIGIPVYFFFLLVLSINRNGKYEVSLQNYAKAQLKTFWLYAVAHLSVLFVTAASMISLVNIIERGLAA